MRSSHLGNQVSCTGQKPAWCLPQGDIISYLSSPRQFAIQPCLKRQSSTQAVKVLFCKVFRNVRNLWRIVSQHYTPVASTLFWFLVIFPTITLVSLINLTDRGWGKIHSICPINSSANLLPVILQRAGWSQSAVWASNMSHKTVSLTNWTHFTNHEGLFWQSRWLPQVFLLSFPLPYQSRKSRISHWSCSLRLA